jgi:TM2 domain-containing membrane protein YozV
MSEEFPASAPRPKLEITFDDLEPETPSPQQPATGQFPPVAGHQPPKPPDYAPVQSSGYAAPPPYWPPPQHPPAQYPPAQHPPAQHPPAQYQQAQYPVPYGQAPGANAATLALAMNHKSEGVAVLLSLLLTGAGQIYCGQVGRGIAFFFGAVFAAFSLIFLVGFVLLPAVWIWAAVDASLLANRQNAMLMASVNQQYYGG